MTDSGSQSPASTTFSGTANYIVSQELQRAVRAAMVLEKPLLIRGEPGTGKTSLATAIAEALGMKLLIWNVKSTTRAQDGLYVYDTVQRLNDSRFGGTDVSDIRRYIKFGVLGQAFQAESRVVVLIDEVDKADIEFPNDLLHELDRMHFTVGETGDQIQARHRPIVIITSNAEKELPDAFLRRCLFHFIEFPDKEQMVEIVRAHHPVLDENLLQECLLQFYEIRKKPMIRKKPSTSELIDWLRILRSEGFTTLPRDRSIPFPETLLKKEEDFFRVIRRGDQ